MLLCRLSRKLLQKDPRPRTAYCPAEALRPRPRAAREWPPPMLVPKSPDTGPFGTILPSGSPFRAEVGTLARRSQEDGMIHSVRLPRTTLRSS